MSMQKRPLAYENLMFTASLVAAVRPEPIICFLFCLLFYSAILENFPYYSPQHLYQLFSYYSRQ